MNEVGSVTPELLLRLYRDIALTKAFNVRMVELKQQRLVPGPIHQTEGGEAAGVGVATALLPDDLISTYYRGYPEWIARGMDLYKLACELLGKADAFTRGKGGEMTFADPSCGIMNVGGIVGGPVPVGVGLALAAKCKGRGQVAAVFFGEGATNTGQFHEAANMAGAFELPAIFVCVNNQWAISTYYGDVAAVEHPADRAPAYGMAGHIVSGQDVVAVYETAAEAVAKARAGAGPSFIEVQTYRIGGHSSTNPETYYMDEPEIERERERDPLTRLRARILDEGARHARRPRRHRPRDRCPGGRGRQASARRAVPRRERGLRRCLRVSTGKREREGAMTVRTLTISAALNEALREEMTRDDSVIVVGEDIAAYGGTFDVTKGLVDEFGRDRIYGTAISEAAIVGAGVGAALAGMRPVVEIMFNDFLTCGMDQLINNAAVLTYSFDGQLKMPLVIRTTTGTHGGSQHSKCLEAWLAHVPGLKVVMPGDPARCQGTAQVGYPLRRTRRGHGEPAPLLRRGPGPR